MRISHTLEQAEMEKTTKQVLAGLQLAMQAELTGREFYKMAAKNTKDPQGKKVFEELAAEEEEHYKLLGQAVTALTTEGKLPKTLRMKKGTKLKAAHPIFSNDFKKRLKKAHFEMSALAVAVQLELNAINHYKAEAQKAPTADVKSFYLDLVKWEVGHYDAFLKQQQELQESYWSEQGFAPF